MRVAVDAMGGDNAPLVEVEGAIAAVREYGVPVILVGDTERVQHELAKYDCKGLDITVHHASEVVGMHDSAADAVRKKRDSSIRVAFDLVKNGEADAVVSAGNSGATMAAACLYSNAWPVSNGRPLPRHFRPCVGIHWFSMLAETSIANLSISSNLPLWVKSTRDW